MGLRVCHAAALAIALASCGGTSANVSHTGDELERAACEGVPDAPLDRPVLAQVLATRAARGGAAVDIDVGRNFAGMALCQPASCALPGAPPVRGVVVALGEDHAELWFPVAPEALASCSRAAVSRVP